MKWFELVGQIDLEEFIIKDDVVKSVKEVGIVFYDGVPTGVLITLKDDTLISFCSTSIIDSGCREGLFVTTTKEIE